MLNFEHSKYLLLTMLLPVLMGIYLLYQFRRRRDIRKIGNPELINSLMTDYSNLRHNLKFVLILLALLFIIIAVAGPRFGSKLTEVKHEGIDIVIALDVSNSMLAEDIKPNRIDR
jgi:Ca-activated chloride channel family protein